MSEINYLPTLFSGLWIHGHCPVPIVGIALCYQEGSFRNLLTLYTVWLTLLEQKQEDERFKKIDAKRGGRGFV